MNIIAKGNHQMFKMFPKQVTKTLTKGERNSYLIPVKLWVLLCSPYARSTLQGIQIKPNKNLRIIWEGSTKTSADQVVLNEHTPTELEVVIDFGQAKTKLLRLIYNWRISFLKETYTLPLQT